MLSLEELKRLAGEWHTNEQNVTREYAQHVFLCCLYGDPAADKLFFKGGTALRILHRSPRFSEDLDFTGNASLHATKNLIEKTARKMRPEINELALTESKPTTGGYFGILNGTLGPMQTQIQIQISLRQKISQGEPMLVTTPLTPSYSVLALQEEEIVREKIEALLARSKPRDFYDLYFILRKPMGNRKLIASKRAAMLKKLEELNSKTIYQELREFLPRSHWAILKNLPDLIKKELYRI